MSVKMDEKVQKQCEKPAVLNMSSKNIQAVKMILQ